MTLQSLPMKITGRWQSEKPLQLPVNQSVIRVTMHSEVMDVRPQQLHLLQDIQLIFNCIEHLHH